MGPRKSPLMGATAPSFEQQVRQRARRMREAGASEEEVRAKHPLYRQMMEEEEARNK